MFEPVVVPEGVERRRAPVPLHRPGVNLEDVGDLPRPAQPPVARPPHEGDAHRPVRGRQIPGLPVEKLPLRDRRGRRHGQGEDDDERPHGQRARRPRQPGLAHAGEEQQDGAEDEPSPEEGGIAGKERHRPSRSEDEHEGREHGLARGDGERQCEAEEEDPHEHRLLHVRLMDRVDGKPDFVELRHAVPEAGPEPARVEDGDADRDPRPREQGACRRSSAHPPAGQKRGHERERHEHGDTPPAGRRTLDAQPAGDD